MQGWIRLHCSYSLSSGKLANFPASHKINHKNVSIRTDFNNSLLMFCCLQPLATYTVPFSFSTYFPAREKKELKVLTFLTYSSTGNMFRNRYGWHRRRVHRLWTAVTGRVMGWGHGIVVLTHAHAGLVVVLGLVGWWGGVG